MSENYTNSWFLNKHALTPADLDPEPPMFARRPTLAMGPSVARNEVTEDNCAHVVAPKQSAVRRTKRIAMRIEDDKICFESMFFYTFFGRARKRDLRRIEERSARGTGRSSIYQNGSGFRNMAGSLCNKGASFRWSTGTNRNVLDSTTPVCCKKQDDFLRKPLYVVHQVFFSE